MVQAMHGPKRLAFGQDAAADDTHIRHTHKQSYLGRTPVRSDGFREAIEQNTHKRGHEMRIRLALGIRSPSATYYWYYDTRWHPLDAMTHPTSRYKLKKVARLSTPLTRNRRGLVLVIYCWLLCMLTSNGMSCELSALRKHARLADQHMLCVRRTSVSPISQMVQSLLSRITTGSGSASSSVDSKNSGRSLLYLKYVLVYQSLRSSTVLGNNCAKKRMGTKKL
jgi:hypothetical protein